jgi:hypothetical protein
VQRQFLKSTKIVSVAIFSVHANSPNLRALH